MSLLDKKEENNEISDDTKIVIVEDNNIEKQENMEVKEIKEETADKEIESKEELENVKVETQKDNKEPEEVKQEMDISTPRAYQHNILRELSKKMPISRRKILTNELQMHGIICGRWKMFRKMSVRSICQRQSSKSTTFRWKMQHRNKNSRNSSRLSWSLICRIFWQNRQSHGMKLRTWAMSCLKRVTLKNGSRVKKPAMAAV
jgi:hypothetical protein